MNFPWGDRDPESGYKVGDYVGIIYSDHDTYIFDNPKGIVVAVEDRVDEGLGSQRLTVQVEVEVSSNRTFRIERLARDR